MRAQPALSALAPLRTLRALGRFTLDLIAPERCPACDALTGAAPGLCAACAESLYPLGPACPRCAEPQAAPAPVVCGRCLRDPPPYVQVRAPFRFGGELATALRRMKYGGPRGAGRPDLVRPLAAHFAPALAQAALGTALVVPVPMSRASLRRRGFAQVERLIGHARAFAPPLPPLRHALHVRGDLSPQASLSQAARRQNLADAFALTAAAAATVQGLRVLLVDDVVTTGATAAAAARALVAAGAAAVEVVALARAEP
jgi:ComF family protein